MNLLEAASRLEREADKYESNSSPGASPTATPDEVALMEKWDEGWLAGVREAANSLRQWAER